MYSIYLGRGTQYLHPDRNVLPEELLTRPSARSSFRAHTLVGRQTLNLNPSLQQVVEKTQRNVLWRPATAPSNLAMPSALWSAGRTWVFTNLQMEILGRRTGGPDALW